VTEDLDAITAEADAYLRAVLPPAWVDAVDRDDMAALLVARQEADADDVWASLGAGGYIVPAWPATDGGLGVSPKAAAAIGRVVGRYRIPGFNSTVGVDMVGPAVRKFGSEAQQARYLRPIAAYEEIWCQLFSEPGSGSDLAGLSTRAVQDGDTWVVNGQKLWTSLGEVARFGIMLARTDPEVPKHQGITAFLVPMDLPGVTVRSVRQITGDAEFCEVFFDDVVLSDDLRLGPVGEGWRVAVSVLNSERNAISGGALPGASTGRSVAALIKRHAPLADPTLRQRLTQAYIEDRLVKLTNQRASDRRKAGHAPGPEGSITKLFFSEHTQRVANLAVDLEGAAAQAWLDDDRWMKGTAWSVIRIRSKTIAGGTSEVQRNILGERILGLPKEAEVDRDVPWSQVLRS
jgi:alkylation response protein AidB-like acyl-CoA dehydrogenase